MINAELWNRIAEKWATESDEIVIPDDDPIIIPDSDLAMFDEISNDEINDILSDLGLEDL